MKAPTVEDVPAPEAASVRDWSELPLDALALVFGKLGAIEILMGAGLVCRSWFEAAKVPELWRSVDMADDVVVHIDKVMMCAMAKVSVDRSGRQLEVFVGKRLSRERERERERERDIQFYKSSVIKFVNVTTHRSPALKVLGLMSCRGVSNKGLSEVIAKFPQLQDLMLVRCNNVRGRDVFEAIGRACPQLNRFRLAKSMKVSMFQLCKGEALGVGAMHGLRSLALVSTDVTNDELAFVLDGCPHLEILDLRTCYNIFVDDPLRARCAAIKSLMLPCARGFMQ
ncbi:hypothetical protein HU200_005056 [Digitaria exilis]|uniref:F-box domain-containing protein n=1 Tax=Digitaria exilis TaxID=1010633 RepID=A0A835FSG8_9POAL|nr:hypothetical protein HU200_005056 [Digitaria exilis]